MNKMATCAALLGECHHSIFVLAPDGQWRLRESEMKTIPWGTENAAPDMPESFLPPKSIKKIESGLLRLLIIVSTLSQLSAIFLLFGHFAAEQ